MAEMNVIWTEPALQELDEIADYISLDNPSAAKKLVQQVFERVELLSRHPESGKKVNVFPVSVYREIVNPPCRVFYRVGDSAIYIIHIIREEQLFHLDILKER